MKLRYLFLLLTGVAAMSLGFAKHSYAACETLPTASQTTYTITTETAGSYKVWLRMKATGEAQNSVWMQIDDQCPVVAGEAKTDDGLLWVNHANGDATQ